MPTSRQVIRTGFGFDSHLFSKSGTLILGGVKFPGTPQLKGHSDGDALFHAVIDAYLGAAVLGDIGEFFPDTDKKWKGADSAKMMREVTARVKKAGYQPLHVDVTILANKPKLNSMKAKLKLSLARWGGLKPSQVNIKAKTQEGLTMFKSPGGIAVWAVATLAAA